MKTCRPRLGFSVHLITDIRPAAFFLSGYLSLKCTKRSGEAKTKHEIQGILGKKNPENIKSGRFVATFLPLYHMGITQVS